MEQFGRLDIMFNNVGIPTPRLGALLEEHTVEDFDKLAAVNLRGVFLGCKHAVIQFKKQGGGGAIVNTGSVAGLVGWGGAVYGATKGAVHQLTKAIAVECAPFGIRANAICPGAMPYTGFMAAGGMDTPQDDARRRSPRPSARPTRSASRSRPRTARRRPCSSCPTGRPTSPASCCRSTAGTWPDERPLLDVERMRELFDLRSELPARSTAAGTRTTRTRSGTSLREEAPVHAGIVHELTGFAGPASFHGLPSPDRPHFSAFSFAACDAVYRNDEVFASSPNANDMRLQRKRLALNSMLSMGGVQHRRYRSLVQPSFVPAKAQWWIAKWIDETVHALIDSFVDNGEAELNVDFCAAIPVLTITGSFGVPVEQALDIREALHQPGRPRRDPRADRRGPPRAEPQDDLISVLVEAEITDEDGTTQRLSDPEIYSFAALLLAAGSGTTWKQMGTTLAALLQRPERARRGAGRPQAVALGHRGVTAVDAD